MGSFGRRPRPEGATHDWVWTSQGDLQCNHPARRIWRSCSPATTPQLSTGCTRARREMGEEHARQWGGQAFPLRELNALESWIKDH